MNNLEEKEKKTAIIKVAISIILLIIVSVIGILIYK